MRLKVKVKSPNSALCLMVTKVYLNKSLNFEQVVIYDFVHFYKHDKIIPSISPPFTWPGLFNNHERAAWQFGDFLGRNRFDDFPRIFRIFLAGFSLNEPKFRKFGSEKKKLWLSILNTNIMKITIWSTCKRKILFRKSRQI